MFPTLLPRVVLFLLIVSAWSARPARAAPPLQYEGGVTFPAPHSVLKGGVAVMGSATHPEFWKYELWLAPGIFPSLPDSAWSRLAIQEQRVSGGQLAWFDSAAFPDGPYTLRLRVVRADGNWQDFDVAPLTIANAAPAPSATPPPTATPEPPPPTATPPPPTEPPPPTPPPGQGTTVAAVATSPPSAAAAATLVPSLESGAATMTPAPVVTRPPAVVRLDPTATAEEIDLASEGGGGASPLEGEGEAPRLLPENGASLWDVTSFAGACFSGLALSASLFLLAGLLYLVRSLVLLLK